MKLYMKDVDGNPQRVKLLYGSKNLIPFPYQNGSTNINGLNFTVNNDGTVVINGTATATTVLYLYLQSSNPIYFPQGTYYIGGSGTLSNNSIRVSVGIARASTSSREWVSNSSFTLENGDGIFQFSIAVDKGVTVNNVVVKPMFNKGTTAQPYDKYFPLSKMNLYLKSRNLIPFPYSGIKNGETRYGITYIIDEHGVITANGVATSVHNTVLRDYFPVTAGQTFRFSSGGASGKSTYKMCLLLYTSKGAASPLYVVEGVGGTTYTVPEGRTYGRVVINYARDAVIENVIFKPMLSEGKTIFPFEPPQEYPN